MFDRKGWMKVYKQYYYKKHRSSLIAYSARWNKLHPEVRALVGAKARCQNPNDHAFEGYGGRGIKFRLSLKDLLDNIGSRPSKRFSLDRINNNGHYEVGNIRWATHKEQQNNRRNSKCYS